MTSGWSGYPNALTSFRAFTASVLGQFFRRAEKPPLGGVIRRRVFSGTIALMLAASGSVLLPNHARAAEPFPPAGSGEIYISDSSGIQRISPDGAESSQIFTSTNFDHEIAVDGNGVAYFISGAEVRYVKNGQDQTFYSDLIFCGAPEAVTAEDRFVYVACRPLADQGTLKIVRLDGRAPGAVSGSFTSPVAQRYSAITPGSTSPASEVYAIDRLSPRIYRLRQNSMNSIAFSGPGGSVFPRSISTDSSGNIWVSYGDDAGRTFGVRKYAPNFFDDPTAFQDFPSINTPVGAAADVNGVLFELNSGSLATVEDRTQGARVIRSGIVGASSMAIPSSPNPPSEIRVDSPDVVGGEQNGASVRVTVGNIGQQTVDISSAIITAHRVEDGENFDFDCASPFNQCRATGLQVGYSYQFSVRLVSSAGSVSNSSQPSSPITFGTSVTTLTTQPIEWTQPGNVRFVAKVVSAYPEAGKLDGQVSFYDMAGKLLGSRLTSSDGTASLDVQSRPLPDEGETGTITAVYSGDHTHSKSTGSFSQTRRFSTGTTLRVESPALNEAGQLLTFNATVNHIDSADAGIPGKIQFFDGSALLGEVDAVKDGGNLSAKYTMTDPVTIGNHSFRAVYSGNPVNVGSSSEDVRMSFIKASSAINATISPSTQPTTLDDVSITATVTPYREGIVLAPTGSVKFTVDGAVVDVQLKDGKATYNFPDKLSSGAHRVTVAYSGDANFNPSNANADFPVVKASTSVKLDSDPQTDRWAPWDPIVFTASVMVEGTSATGASGTMTFYDNGTPLATAGVANGIAVYTLEKPSLGSHKITAKYFGDSVYGPSSLSDPLQQEVKKAGSSVTVASSQPDDASYGQVVEFTANVAVQDGSPSPANNSLVTFKDGDRVLGSVAVVDGAASFSVSSLTAGPHTITAVFGGDEYHDGSSAALTQRVLAGTTTTVVSSGSPSAVGQEVTFTATVSGDVTNTPTGTVQFTDEAGDPIGAPVPLENGKAKSPAVKYDTVGSYSVHAAYTSDNNVYRSGSSGTTTQVVVVPDSTTTLSASTDHVVFGQEITLTATVAGQLAAPEGSVTFSYDGGKALGGAVPLQQGTAVLTTADLPAGTHTVVATFTSTNVVKGSHSDGLAVVVDQATSTTVVFSSQNPSSTGKDVTFTASVTGPDNSTVQDGTVTFYDNDTDTQLGEAAELGADGTATLTLDTLSAGEHSVFAVYSGGDTYTTSTSEPIVQTVGEATSSTDLKSSPNPSAPNAEVTFTATVTGPQEDSPTPTGSVTFFDNTTTLGEPVTLDEHGVAELKVSNLTGGTHAVSAVFTGTQTYAESTSTGTVDQTVADLLTITTTSLPNATVGSPYDATIATTGGQAPYSWELASGSVPAGLTFRDGRLSGTPTTAGTAGFAVTVHGSTGQSATQPLTLVINSPSASPTPSPSSSASPSATSSSDTPVNDPGGNRSPSSTTSAKSSSPAAAAKQSSTPATTIAAVPAKSSSGAGALAQTGGTAGTVIGLSGIALIAGGALLYRKFRS